jgi:hypothetical protein
MFLSQAALGDAQRFNFCPQKYKKNNIAYLGIANTRASPTLECTAPRETFNARTRSSLPHINAISLPRVSAILPVNSTEARSMSFRRATRTAFPIGLSEHAATSRSGDMPPAAPVEGCCSVVASAGHIPHACHWRRESPTGCCSPLEGADESP